MEAKNQVHEASCQLHKQKNIRLQQAKPFLLRQKPEMLKNLAAPH